MNHLLFSILLHLFICISVVLSQAVPPAPTLPVLNACAANTLPVFVLHMGRSSPSGGTSFSADTLDYCSFACEENMNNDVSSLCAGFTYSGTTCTLYSTFQISDLTAGIGDFYQKACVASGTNACSSAFHFEAVPQKMLSGFARGVSAVASLQECMQRCLDNLKIAGWECQSLMYYGEGKDCVLNSETRYQRPDLFVDDSSKSVVYMDNNCAGGNCFPPFIPQYVQVPGKSLRGEFNNGIKTMAAQSLTNCAYLCTHQILAIGNFTCKSFMYRTSDQTCVLSDERAVPLGRRRLVSNPGVDYYEKVCLLSNKTCRNVPAFVRFPQMVLAGLAAYVMELVPTPAACLDLCTNPPPQVRAGFVCKSVLYYYNEQECILNTRSRLDRPDMFSPDVQGNLVDYYDVACVNGESVCRAGSNTTVIRSSRLKLPGNRQFVNAVVPATSVSACVSACTRQTSFVCRSFDFTGTECRLSYLTVMGIDLVADSAVDHYEIVCLFALGSLCANGTGFSVSYDSRVNASAPLEFRGPVALPDCLTRCLHSDGFMCRGINYNKCTGVCGLLDVGPPLNTPIGSPSSGAIVSSGPFPFPAGLVLSNGVRASDNMRLRRQTLAISPLASQVQGSIVDDICFDYYVNDCVQPMNGPVVTPMCRFDTFSVMVQVPTVVNGVIYAKNKYNSCRVELINSTKNTLILGFPPARPALPVVTVPYGAYDYTTQAYTYSYYGYAPAGSTSPSPTPRSPGTTASGMPTATPQAPGFNTYNSYSNNYAYNGNGGMPGAVPPPPGYSNSYNSYYGNGNSNIGGMPSAVPPAPGTFNGYFNGNTMNRSSNGGMPSATPPSPSGGMPTAQPPPGFNYFLGSYYSNPGGSNGMPSATPRSPSEGANYNGNGYNNGRNGGYNNKPAYKNNRYGGMQYGNSYSNDVVRLRAARSAASRQHFYVRMKRQMPSATPRPPGIGQPSRGSYGRYGGRHYNYNYGYSNKNSRDCGVTGHANGTYCAVIVVQTNNLGIPGLVTSLDNIYHVCCDYSRVSQIRITTNTTINVK